MRNKVYGVAHIGFGVLGKALFSEVNYHPRFKNIAVHDINTEKLDGHGQIHKGCVQDATEVSQVLNNPDVDIIFVNTPAETHFEICRAALQSGKHVHCAKPLTLNTRDSYALVRLAKTMRVSLTVGHQMKYNLHYQFLKKVVESKLLGKIHSLSFINNKSRLSPGNLKQQRHPILWEMSTHHFDSILYLFPRLELKLQSAHLSRTSGSAYESSTNVNAIFSTKPGTTLLYQAGFETQRSNYYFRIEGAKGVLDILGDHVSKPVKHYLFSDRTGQALLTPPTGRDERTSWSKVFDAMLADISAPESSEISAKRNLTILKLVSDIEKNAYQRN